MTSPEQSGSDLPDDLPLLTQVVDENFPDGLPTLTEIASEQQAGTTVEPRPAASQETTAPGAVAPPPPIFGDEEMQQMLLQLETHLETVFADKLSFHLEELQRQAVGQAISELRAELPGLLRDALNARPGL